MPKRPTYEVERFGLAYGIVRPGSDNPDDPILTLWDRLAAEDLCRVLNWAAGDRERHEGLEED